MAKKQNQPTRTKLEDINDSLSGLEQKFEKNQKLIYSIVGAVLVIALLWLAYNTFIAAPNLEKANAELSKADVALLMNNDSTTALKGYEKVAKNYSNEAGNLAKAKAASILYGQGKTAQALKYLEDYSPKGKIVSPSSQSLLGDCYVNTKKYDKALSAYDKAISLAGDNKVLVAGFLIKKANVLHFQKKYADELAIYNEIETKYSDPGSIGSLDAKIAAAEALLNGNK